MRTKLLFSIDLGRILLTRLFQDSKREFSLLFLVDQALCQELFSRVDILHPSLSTSISDI